tara:strand:+ start:766 stop:1104 length:339 start_codon:yes stop_codon:yes gene_type:complete
MFSNLSFSAKGALEGYVGEDRTVISVKKVFDSAPTYPRNALRMGREGYVLIEFDVDTDGSVLDPYVVESEPTGVFERSAIKAVRKWLFSPPVYKDVSVKVNDVRARVTFALD